MMGKHSNAQKGTNFLTWVMLNWNKPLRTLLGVILLFMAVLTITLLINTARLPDYQFTNVATAPVINLAPDSTAARLAGALRIATISHTTLLGADTLPFSQFHRYLKQTFPRVHERLGCQTFRNYAVLYEWPGTDPTLKPLLLLAHQDVVPALTGGIEKWKHPPFAGQIVDGYIYGRGALDDKLNVLGELEAVEYLLQNKFKPKRTILMAFGHDEEVSGSGAKAIAEALRKRYPGLEMVLDEGGIIKSDGVAGITQPVALVGVSEKGQLNVQLSSTGEGGHASMPPRTTAVGRLAAAVARIEANPFPARLDGGAAGLLTHLAPAAPFYKRVVFANPWLFGSLIKKNLAATAAGNAALRTTTAATVFNGGEKANVLPVSATATINFRLLPGESVKEVINRVIKLVNDQQVQIKPLGEGYPASPVSATSNRAFHTLQRTINSIFPQVLVAPYVSVGATDASSYASLCSDATYRFMPVYMGQKDIISLHGTNERISIAAYQQLIRFYVALIKNIQ